MKPKFVFQVGNPFEKKFLFQVLPNHRPTERKTVKAREREKGNERGGILQIIQLFCIHFKHVKDLNIHFLTHTDSTSDEEEEEDDEASIPILIILIIIIIMIMQGR